MTDDLTNLFMSDFKSLYKSPQINGAIGRSVWYNVKNGEICFATELKNFNLAQRRASLMQLLRMTSNDILLGLLYLQDATAEKYFLTSGSLLSHSLSRNYKFQDYCIWIPGLFQGFPGPRLFPGLSRPGKLNILIPGLSRTFQGLYEPCKHRYVRGYSGLWQIFCSLYLSFSLLLCVTVLLLFVNVLNYCTLYCIVLIFCFKSAESFSPMSVFCVLMYFQ